MLSKVENMKVTNETSWAILTSLTTTLIENSGKEAGPLNTEGRLQGELALAERNCVMLRNTSEPWRSAVESFVIIPDSLNFLLESV